MIVRALKPFACSVHGSFTEGDVFTLPKGADFLKAGLVEKVAPAKRRKKAAPKSDDDPDGGGGG